MAQGDKAKGNSNGGMCMAVFNLPIHFQAERIREHKLKQDRKKRERDIRERKRKV